MGFCIGGPMILNLIKRAPERVVAAAMMQPSGSRPEMPDLFYENNIKGWGPALCERRPDLTMAMVHDFCGIASWGVPGGPASEYGGLCQGARGAADAAGGC